LNLTRTIGVTIYCYEINFIVTSKSRTQKKQLIVIDQLWHLVRTFKRGAPTSVLTYTNTKVNKLNEGVPFAKGPLLPTDFWEFLNTWGGTWMWESIDNSQQSKHNLSWLVEGMESNTLTWVTDGSLDRKRAADLCGVRWIIFCIKTGLRLTGTFWERSPSVSSYHAEILGLCGLHLFARALSEFYQICATVTSSQRAPRELTELPETSNPQFSTKDATSFASTAPVEATN
jgi:hypothetical protein